MRYTFANFGGITPRLSDHSLAPNAATIAHDAKLRNGRIESWRERCAFSPAALGAQSFHIYGCCAVSWPEAVKAANMPPDWSRFYITGRRPYLEAVEVDCHCNPSYYRAGVPAPTTAPTITGTEACGRAADARTYIYTFVNKWGEESAPSPASNMLVVDDGTTVQIRGLELPPEDYGITHINLYRGASAFRVANGKDEQKPVSDFFYVTTIELPRTTFTDTVKTMSLGPACNTMKTRVPPEGLRNICKIEGIARLAGTTTNRVHLSENLQPHNWPIKYELTLPHGIVNMGCLDQKLYVSTDSMPYVISVDSCEDMKCTPVLDVGVRLPDISCGHAASSVITPYGFIYSSPIGAILIDAEAKFTILTAKWMSSDDWQQIKPETARFGFYEGFLFIITDAVSLVLNIDGNPFGDLKGAELTTISDKPVDLHQTATGKLMLLEGGTIFTWDSGDQYREFLWVSRDLTFMSEGKPMGYAWSPSSVKVDSEDVRFELRDPQHDTVLYDRKILGRNPVRLPRVGRHQAYRVSLSGIKAVKFLDLGTAHTTVNEGV